MRVFFRIVLIVLPILFVIGIIRYFINGFDGDFVPTWDKFQFWFSGFPDIQGDWATAVSRFDSQIVGCAVEEATPWGMFQYLWCRTWKGFDNWWNAFSGVITVIFTTPLKIIGWFFSVLTI